MSPLKYRGKAEIDEMGLIIGALLKKCCEIGRMVVLNATQYIQRQGKFANPMTKKEQRRKIRMGK